MHSVHKVRGWTDLLTRRRVKGYPKPWPGMCFSKPLFFSSFSHGPIENAQKHKFINTWEPVDYLQGSLGSSGPEPPKKSEKKKPLGVWGPRTPQESGKSLEKVFRNLFETFSRLSQTFSRLFPDSRGVPRPEAPGDFFRLFSGFRAQRDRETPVNGQ